MSSILHKLKQSYLDARILLSYGKLNPEWVELPPHQHLVSINPRDNRARKIVLADTIRGKYRQNRDFWERACRILSPDWALDVGVNYGECLFLPSYAPHTNVLGIEANPELSKYLRASREKHPQSGQIDIQFGVATNVSGGETQFFINEQWSGSSTVALSRDDEDSSHYRAVTVPMLCVDDLIENTKSIANRTLVFKIDVEGYESHVLAGMSQTLATAKWALGMIEFDPTYLKNAGVDACKFFHELQQQFEVWMFISPRRVISTREIKFEELARRSSRKNLHTDLILSGGVPQGLLQQILDPWLQRSARAA